MFLWKNKNFPGELADRIVITYLFFRSELQLTSLTDPNLFMTPLQKVDLYVFLMTGNCDYHICPKFLN